jgi:putative nucleotidyltransferase with HDIG domain
MHAPAERPAQAALAIAEEVLLLYERYGDASYDGEPVTQSGHMTQCAGQAMAAGAGEELVLCAFLHDIGHLLQGSGRMDGFGVIDHEGLGASWLRERGFSSKVCAVVGGHVAAKRYLVATDPGYAQRLSEASRQTLA